MCCLKFVVFLIFMHVQFNKVNLALYLTYLFYWINLFI